MRQRLTTLLLSVALLCTLTLPAFAGTFNNSGIFFNYSGSSFYNSEGGSFDNRGILHVQSESSFANNGSVTNSGTLTGDSYISGSGMITHTTVEGTIGTLSWKLTQGVLYINGTGKIPDFDTFSYGETGTQPWYPYRSAISTVVIGEGVTHIGRNAFRGLDYLQHASLSETVVEIGEGAFSFCTELMQITWDQLSNLTTIGVGAFFGCQYLTSVTIPANVSNVGGQVFGACVRLKSIIVAEGNKHYKSENGVLFTSNGKKLVSYPVGNTVESYTVPDGVTEIEAAAFQIADYLTDVKIADSVTAIGMLAFDGCSNLTIIEIPASVKSIGEKAFDHCSKLVKVKYSGTQAQWNTISIATGNSALTGADIKYTETAGGDVYTVTLNTNGGTICSGDVTEYTAGIGATLPTDVVKEDYAFGGWYDDATFGNEVKTIGEDDVGEKTFYAKWVANSDGGRFSITGIRAEQTGNYAVFPATISGDESVLDYISFNFLDASGNKLAELGGSFRNPTGYLEYNSEKFNACANASDPVSAIEIVAVGKNGRVISDTKRESFNISKTDNQTLEISNYSVVSQTTDEGSTSCQLLLSINASGIGDSAFFKILLSDGANSETYWSNYTKGTSDETGNGTLYAGELTEAMRTAATNKTLQIVITGWEPTFMQNETDGISMTYKDYYGAKKTP